MNARKLLALWAACLGWTTVANAQPRAIDAGRSSITVRVFKSGVFSAFGHDHEIAAPIARGAVDANAGQVELQTNARALEVRDVKASDKERAEIQSTMLGPAVLDAERHPEIVFRSVRAERTGAGAWRVSGNLTLHGQTRPVAVEVRESGGHYVGTSQFKQSDFGIQPVKVAGGTIRVKDEVRIDFDIQLTP